MRKYLTQGLLLSLAFFLIAASPAAEKKIPAPDFMVKDLDQISVKLSEYKDKKPVILFFWTTWCPYCQTALKNLSRTQADLEKEGIEVLAINAGEPPSKVARFVKNNGFTFRVFLDFDSSISDAYNVYGVPVYFAVDKKGFLRKMAGSLPLEEARGLAREK